MGSICLSAASILRCTPATPRNSSILIIPTTLEVVFSSSLLFVSQEGGRRNLLLTAEGWIYFVLSLLELIRTVVPSIRCSVPLFQGFDLGIGVASFLPLFFYTFFLYLFTSNDLIDALPKSISNISKLSLILFLTAIIVFNEIASFVGVKITTIVINGSKPTVATGFANQREAILSTFFTSTTLALLIIFQFAVFCFSFFRLARALTSQRRIEKEGSDKAHFVNGMAWICIGLKLGALESVVGFTGGTFGINLIRRTMRMMARASLYIGVAKGVDTAEDFRVVQKELRISASRGRGIRTIRLMISNPRFSSFRQLSPTAASFHATHSAAVSIKEQDLPRPAHYTTTSQRQSRVLQSGLPGMRTFADVKEARTKQMVTVHYEGGTPKLHMRFSRLDDLGPFADTNPEKKPRKSSLGVVHHGETVLELPYVSEKTYYSDDSQSELQIPTVHFHKDAASTMSYRDSFNSAPSVSAFEIVDARKLPQRAAVGQVYLPSVTPTTQKAASPIQEIALPEPTYQAGTAEPDKPRRNRDSSKMKSIASIADSFQAVRDLTGQFPGPPGISQLRPVESGSRHLPSKTTSKPAVPRKEEKSVWEEDSRTSVQYASGMGLSTPRVIGSPSQLAFSTKAPNSSVEAVENAYDGIETPRERASLRAGKVPVVAGGYKRMSVAPPRRSRATSLPKPIDPSSDDASSIEQPSKTPIYAPVGKPLRQSLGIRTNKVPPVPPELETPSTYLSNMTPIHEAMANRIEPFIDFATALDTGKSRAFRPSLPAVHEPPTPRRMSTIPAAAERSMSHAQEKHTRIAQWVDTSAKVAMLDAEPAMPSTPATIVTPTMVDSPVDMKREDVAPSQSLQNLHGRGPSIDALSIPWPQNQRPNQEEARWLGGAVATELGAPRPKITTVGKAPSRTTPAPMSSAAARASLYLLPIVVPPRNGNLPQIEYETIETPVVRRATRDSDVIDLEDSLMRPPRQSIRPF